jgi:2-methylcitrate dehydratase PrpD
VASVQVGVTRQALARLPFATPQNGWEARFCLSYILAATLLQGPPLIDHFTKAAVQDADVRRMMDRISVAAAETATPRIPNPSAIAITLSDGRRLRHRVEFARGQPELPLDTDELDAKFLYCSRYILPADHIEEAIGSFRNLEGIANITGMASVLGG